MNGSPYRTDGLPRTARNNRPPASRKAPTIAPTAWDRLRVPFGMLSLWCDSSHPRRSVQGTVRSNNPPTTTSTPRVNPHRSGGCNTGEREGWRGAVSPRQNGPYDTLRDPLSTTHHEQPGWASSTIGDFTGCPFVRLWMGGVRPVHERVRVVLVIPAAVIRERDQDNEQNRVT